MDTLASLGFKVDSKPLDKATGSLRGLDKEAKNAEKSTTSLGNATKFLGAALASLGVAQLTRNIFQTVRSTEALQASLKTVTGSTEAASMAWGELVEFAKTTPFTLDQSVKAFIKMRALGLNPTTKAIASFGNTSAAMGKDLNQMIEAVADASTGEFERLKEFGIKAKVEGDNISFTFQGVTTTIGKNADEITRYLQGIGDVQFSGAMADQMATLNGQISNLEDSIDGLFREIGDAGATNLFKDFVSGSASAVNAMRENLDVVGSVAAGVGAASSAYVVLAGVTSAATMAQTLFNVASRANPYIFLATTIAGAAAAIYTFINAQESAIEVWENATKSEAAYQAAISDVSAQNRVQEITKERMRLKKELQWIEKNGFNEFGSYAKKRQNLIADITELETEYHAITNARIEAEKAQGARESIKLAEIKKQKELLLELEKKIKEASESAGEESAKAFINPWQSAADGVAQSLQDAIASGDWKSIGQAIGNALSTSMSAVVNKSITDKLAKGLTQDSSTLAQIGGAFAGPIAGAVVGGAIQVALREIEDYFGDDWDPTAQRQARQGTGTVLGEISSKTESVIAATEMTASATTELVGLNRSMLIAMQAVQAGISRGSARVAQASSGISLTNAVTNNAWEKGIVGDFADMTADFFDFITLDLFDFGSMLGGKSKKKDEGIQIIGGYINDLIDETMVNAYATFRVKKHSFDDYDTKERYSRIGGDVEDQFSAIFMGLYDGVVSAAQILGIDAAARLRNFQIETQKLSLEKLSAEEQQKELEAYFGTVFDGMAKTAVPFLQDFQLAGEGLAETLSRLANNAAVVAEVVDMVGLQFRDLSGEQLVIASERLIELSGGLDNFISSSQNFISSFATQEQQFELNSATLAKSMGSLPLPETREGFYSLLQAQDASTASGAANVATLLRVQGVADSYYKYLEKTTDEQARAVEEQFNQVASAADSLRGMYEPLKNIERSAALKTLEHALATGDISGIGDAARIAAQINERDFSTAADFRLEQARTLNLLGRLEQLGAGKSPEVLLLEQANEIQSAQLSTLNMIATGSPLSSPVTAMSYPDLMASVGMSQELLAEIKGLRAETLASQRAIEKNTREIKLIQDSWDRLGLPEERVIA